VNADPIQLERVVLSLAADARDAMPRGGRLILETANVTLDEDSAGRLAEVLPGPYVLLSVSDTGETPSSDATRPLEEPNFGTRGRGRGTGLGLAACHRVVRQSGGTVGVYSEPGKGTCVQLYLPQAEGAAEPSSPAEPGDPLPRSP
jgi:signal transduction histidine kinase